MCWRVDQGVMGFRRVVAACFSIALRRAECRGEERIWMREAVEEISWIEG